MNNASLGGEPVSYMRRFFGDDLLEALIFCLTLGIGWLIWFAIVAPKGKTPAKQLLSVYIHDIDSGVIASTGQVWMREVVGKWLLAWVIGIVGVVFTHSVKGGDWGNLYSLIAAVWIFFDPSRRALWDYVAGTVVRYYPDGRPLPASASTTAGMGSSF